MDKISYKISFIVPVYNVEKYVKECIDSILSIKSFCYELIIVNDGSTDASMQVVTSICPKNANIKIFTQQNRGLSAARNVGVSLASGEYIYFIDSDDKISTDNLQCLVEEISGDEDIVIGNFSTFCADGMNIQNHCKIPHKKTAFGGYFLEKYYLKEIYTVVWRNLYKRNFILENKLRFMEGVTYEDVEWSPRALWFAKKVTYYNYSIYNYRKREGSIVNSTFSSKKYEDIINVGISLASFTIQVHPSSEVIYVIHESIAYFVLLALAKVKKYPSCFSLESGIILFEMLCLRNPKYKFLRLILRFCPFIFWRILQQKFYLI